MTKLNTNEMPKSLFRVDLRRLIFWLCLFFTILALGNSLYAAYKVQHDLTLQHSLHVNRVQAEKLAQIANSFLKSSARILETAAQDITESRLDPAATQKELTQLSTITETFSTLIAVDASGKILAAMPPDTALSGGQLQALLNWQGSTDNAVISGPFQGPTGRWLSVIAHPLLSSEGHYAGFVAGTVRLQSGSALQNALHEHPYQDRSYFYIVDETGALVYHPKQSLLGTSVKELAPVPALLRGEAGTRRISALESHDLLVSYVPIPFAKWGLVMQRPTQAALANLPEQFLRTFYYSLPLFILSLWAIWWLAKLIAHPLRELAYVAANLNDPSIFSRIRFIKSWYLEVALIRQGLRQGFSAVRSRIRKLHREGATDPLTGLLNRRGLDAAIEGLVTTPNVAIVAIDIDHFKAVNDKHGHAVGDDLLKAVAASILAEARAEDVVARIGGEEFVILLPHTGLSSATRFAERLRSIIETTRFDSAGRATISLGIACCPEHGANIHDCLLVADAALYRAKAAGRNRAHPA